MSYKFIKTRDTENRFDNIDIQIEADCETIDELLEVFERFLQASGFVYKGKLDLVEDEEG